MSLFPSRNAAALALLVLLTAPGAHAATRAVEGVGLTVSDLDAALRFYTEVLPFERVSEVEIAGADNEHLLGVFGLRARVAHVRLGRETLDLTEFLAPEGRPIPRDSRSNDGWFQHVALVVSDMDRAYAHLREKHVRHASSGPQLLPLSNPNAGGISAFYFKDPDGHVLEVIHFPKGKGNPRWQEPDGRLFLGIDHTAIVVADTDRSLAFYQGLLGLRVAGTSENFGTEQEHLNNVFGARLRITGLTAGEGPGVELLEYLAPQDGRAYPQDSTAADLWHWNTILRVDEVEAAIRPLRAGAGRWISPGEVALPGRELGASAGALVRDPDGHALLVIER